MTIILYLAAYSLVFVLCFNYARFCLYFKKKYGLETMEANINQVGKSLFPSFEFSTDWRELKHEERWLTYFIVTVPTLAVCIRCTYHDYRTNFSGLYVLNWQLIIHAAAFFLAMVRYKSFASIIGKLPLKKLATTSICKDEVRDELASLLTESELNASNFSLLKTLNDKFTKKITFF